MNRILVTGGSGFLGRHLVKKLLDRYKDTEIRTISRNENDIARMLALCDSSRVKPVVGDIRDIDALKYALKEADVVIHLVAMKHIEFCESYPQEALTINTIGTMSLLKLFTGSIFIGMSTDKAVEATTCYGGTKLLMERLILEQAQKNEGRKYMVVRAGNIFGSSGSVLEKWEQQIKQKNEITVTDPKMTRFFINVDGLADFIITIMEHGESGNIYIPPEKGIEIEKLARAFINTYGDKQTKVKVIGLRKGEKIHERLLSESEEHVITDMKTRHSELVEQLSIEEIKSWLHA